MCLYNRLGARYLDDVTKVNTQVVENIVLLKASQ